MESGIAMVDIGVLLARRRLFPLEDRTRQFSRRCIRKLPAIKVTGFNLFPKGTAIPTARPNCSNVLSDIAVLDRTHLRPTADDSQPVLWAVDCSSPVLPL